MGGAMPKIGCFLAFFLSSKVGLDFKNGTFLKALFFKGFRSPFFFLGRTAARPKKEEAVVSSFGRCSPEDALLDVGTLESLDVSLELPATTTQRGVASRSEVHGTLEC